AVAWQFQTRDGEWVVCGKPDPADFNKAGWRFRPLYTRSAKAVDGEATVWLVEWPEDDNVPVRWWNPNTGWMRDANKAMHFARMSDAADYIASVKMVTGVKPTEHKFLALLTTGNASSELKPNHP